ncbi:hypothetical protein NKK52_18280 [Mesorhizobium sp. C277A]|uniref:hypothetical protein n=1 Tax=Mesorhizobium sp. C277A TaxID=2956827 RepID=UPI0012EC3A39|nr:hypothetical protein [Mesorhizobium sp. LSJC277A00]
MDKRLDSYQVKGRGNNTQEIRWDLRLELEGDVLEVWTDSRIVMILLQSSLLLGRKNEKWPISLDLDRDHLKQVHIQDMRDEVCKGEYSDAPEQAVIPFFPTALVNEKMGICIRNWRQMSTAQGRSNRRVLPD